MILLQNHSGFWRSIFASPFSIQFNSILLIEETNRLHLNSSPIQSPVLSIYEATVERKNSLLTGRNFCQNQTQEGWPSASTSLGLRGQERGDNKQHNTRPWIPAERESQVNDNDNVIDSSLAFKSWSLMNGLHQVVTQIFGHMKSSHMLDLVNDMSASWKAVFTWLNGVREFQMDGAIIKSPVF